MSWNTTPRDLEVQAQRSAQRIGNKNGVMAPPSPQQNWGLGTNPNMGSTDTWHDLNANKSVPDAFGPAGQGPGNMATFNSANSWNQTPTVPQVGGPHSWDPTAPPAKGLRRHGDAPRHRG